MIKQISVFVENKKGRLHKLTELLSNEGIDLRALSISDTTDFGILRCIVEDPDKTLEIIKSNHYTASINQVIAAEVGDTPGGLAMVLKVLSDNDISVEYLYSFVKRIKSDALIIFRVEDPDAAIEALEKNNIKVLDEKQLFAV